MNGGEPWRVRVLVVEDDGDLRRLLASALDEEGFEVEMVADGSQALARVETGGIDLLVLDVGLPDADGRDVCQALRARGESVPVLFLTAFDALPDRIAGFGAGGDDYLPKPFDFAELTVRLRALARRAGQVGEKAAGDITLDPVSHSVAVGGRSAGVTPTEFRLLGALMARPGEAVRRGDLVRAGWPHGAIVHDNTLDVYIARLRRKLRELTARTEIHTVHGVGYCLQ